MRVKVIQKFIDILRYKKNNERQERIKIIGNSVIEYSNEDKNFLFINVIGNDNRIIIKKLSAQNKGIIGITLFGDNCEVIIDENLYISGHLNIFLGNDHPNYGKINNVKLHIGESSTIESCKIATFNSNNNIFIGKNCMFSHDVTIFNSDSHPILDYKTGMIQNKVRDLTIGNHVWLGAFSTILKNTSIPDNSIVGWASVVTTKYGLKEDIKNLEGGIILAGNPAKIVKQGITWDADASKGYVQNILE